jgi:hypothetical protein
MYFIWSIDDSKGSNSGIHRGKWEVLAHTGATEGLDRSVNDLLSHARYCYLDSGNLLPC